MNHAKRLLLFDLDGVILDSRANMEASWQEVCRTRGLTVPFDAYFAHIGRPFREILARIGIDSHHEEIERLYRITSARLGNLNRYYDGVFETLCQLVNLDIKLGVVTSKDTLRTNAILAGIPICFDTIQTPRPNYRGKPAPDHLLLAMAECNVDPAETAFIGDMDVDCEAACRAGVEYIHAGWGYGAAPGGASRICDAFVNLTACLKLEP